MFYPDFKEAVVVTTLKKDDSGDFLIPDFPNKWYDKIGLCLVYCNGINYYGYPIPFSQALKGQECICQIVYQRKLNKKVKEFVGYLGKGKIAKLTAKYQEKTGSTDPLYIFNEDSYVDADVKNGVYIPYTGNSDYDNDIGDGDIDVV